ncbi:hypothetical protein [Hyalangium versicolor]|uniref:hypothetical protein n=1 Tax=Hyalangium versicolor TaxID=2861190 RepID=UPI001CCC7D14|nr:hypothetical protein [Hyalangium versicolor]
MASEMDEVLQHIQELNRSARKPGELSRTQLEAEVKKVSAAVQASLAKLGVQLPPAQAAKPAQKQKEKLNDQMKQLKWGFIRT